MQKLSLVLAKSYGIDIATEHDSARHLCNIIMTVMKMMMVREMMMMNMMMVGMMMNMNMATVVMMIIDSF